MCFNCATMSRKALQDAVSRAVRYPHSDISRGKLIISEEAFRDDDRETNMVISPYCILDCTGSIFIGPWCNIGPRTRIYTHDHIHAGREPLSRVQEQYGILFQDKTIGRDVWIHDGSLVLYQVTCIPDGVVLGGGSVLTRNPGPYEIWAGNPARKIGERTDIDSRALRDLACGHRYSLDPAIVEKTVAATGQGENGAPSDL